MRERERGGGGGEWWGGWEVYASQVGRVGVLGERRLENILPEFFLGKTNYNFYSYILQSTKNVLKVDQELAMKHTLESAENIL